jgi:pimeloyl-ACP methyl ester carboxylesterase
MGRMRMRTAGIVAIAGPVVPARASPNRRIRGQTRSRLECALRQFGNRDGRRPDLASERATRIQVIELRGVDMSEPTVVFVHGAFADSSSWNGVITRLRAKGVPVMAPPNPLRGLSADSAYIASILEAVAAVASVPVEA